MSKTPKIAQVKTCHDEYENYYLEYELVDMGLYPNADALPVPLYNGRNCNSISTYYSIEDCHPITDDEIDKYYEWRRDEGLKKRNKGKDRRPYKSVKRKYDKESYRGFWCDKFLLNDYPEKLLKLRELYPQIRLGGAY